MAVLRGIPRNAKAQSKGVTMTIPIDIAELERLERAAPKGWCWYQLGGSAHLLSEESSLRPVIITASSHNRTPYLATRDASGLLERVDVMRGIPPAIELIPQSRNALPELIASLKIAVEALEKLEGWEMLFRLEGGLSYQPGPPTLIREKVSSPAREALAEIRKRVTL